MDRKKELKRKELSVDELEAVASGTYRPDVDLTNKTCPVCGKTYHWITEMVHCMVSHMEGTDGQEP